MKIGTFAAGFRVSALAVSALVGVSAVGCDSSPSPDGTGQMMKRQDRALNDPMGYKPDFSQNRVTSGGVFDTDKEGLKRDMRSVFGP